MSQEVIWTLNPSEGLVSLQLHKRSGDSRCFHDSVPGWRWGRPPEAPRYSWTASWPPGGAEEQSRGRCGRCWRVELPACCGPTLCPADLHRTEAVALIGHVGQKPWLWLVWRVSHTPGWGQRSAVKLPGLKPCVHQSNQIFLWLLPSSPNLSQTLIRSYATTCRFPTGEGTASVLDMVDTEHWQILTQWCAADCIWTTASTMNTFGTKWLLTISAGGRKW